MKKIAFLLLSFLIISCSSSDDNGGTPIIENFDYFPLTMGSNWTYNNEDTEQDPTRDSLYVSSIEVINGFDHSEFSALNPVSGFMTNVLSQSMLRTTDNELILNGVLGTPPVEGFPEIAIPLIDVIIYDMNKSNGSLLSEVTGEIEEVIEDIPLKIGYNIRTIQGEIMDDGYGIYTDSSVLTSKIIVNLSIFAGIELIPGTIIEIPILQPQDVITSTNYFADGIGVIFCDTQIEYQLEDLSALGIELPIPTEGSSIATQSLDTYQIGN
jgi:hypothetical protein